MGRPSKLDDLTAQRIVAAVEKGLPRRTAAQLARVAPSTLFLWLQRGRDGDPDYSDFSDRVREAESKGEEAIVAMLRVHAANSWQACAFLLERRNPKAWAARKNEPAAEKPAGAPQSREEHLALAESVVAALRSAES